MSAPGDPPAVEASVLANLDARAREIFRRIVDSYLASGDPVGSRHLSRILPISLSPASIRNVMQDLEELGLVYAPHTSAGRLPTQQGLRFYVDALLEFGGLGDVLRKFNTTFVQPQRRRRTYLALTQKQHEGNYPYRCCPESQPSHRDRTHR